MFSSSILSALETYLGYLAVLADWEIQVTSAEEPFPSSGDNIITIYPIRFNREPKDQTITLFAEVEVCFTKRAGKFPYDRQRKMTYDLIASLTSLTELVGLGIDSNHSLTTLISNNIISKRNEMITALGTSNSASTTLAAQLATTQVVEPTKIVEFIVKPIPREDRFFTAYDQKRQTGSEFLNDRVMPSGYSTKLRIRSPKIITNSPC